MRYTVYVKYLNGATGESYTEGTKAKIYQWFTKIMDNQDLRQTAEAVIIDAPRGEVYRYELSSGAPVPVFGAIPWPKRGRALSIEDGKTVSAFITEDDQKYLREVGDGNCSRGIRALVNESKNLKEAQAQSC